MLPPPPPAPEMLLPTLLFSARATLCFCRWVRLSRRRALSAFASALTRRAAAFLAFFAVRDARSSPDSESEELDEDEEEEDDGEDDAEEEEEDKEESCL